MTKICIYLVVIIFLGKAEFADPQKTSSTYLYRVQNWCIIGRGEFELFEFPFLQFRPFLRAGDRVRSFEDNFNDMDDDKKLKEYYDDLNPTSLTLKFKAIKCEAPWPDADPTKWPEPANFKKPELVLGRVPDSKGEYLQRAHVEFTSDKPIAGLIIQGVHAPFGLGFPFGQFDETSEFECNDCTDMHSAIIGCISRPGGELMHPTVAAFHHKYKHPSEPSVEVGKKEKIHWNYKWNDNKCSSAFIVEFWALIVLSFEDKIWMTHKFGPYNFETDKNQRIIINPYNHKEQKSIGQPGIPTPIMPRCQKRRKPDPLPLPAICSADPLPSDPPTLADDCKQEKQFIRDQLKLLKPDPPTNGIQCHINNPSEHKDYGFLVENKDPKPAGEFISSDLVHKSKWSTIRFVGSYDVECVQKFNSTIKFKYPYKVCPEWQAKYFCGGPEDFTFNNARTRPENPKKRLFPESHCIACVTLPTTPREHYEDEVESWIKRKPHTILMIFAFFFVLPLSAFIGRFYKETLHTCEFKGWRLWLIIHSLSSVLTLLLCYASYSLVTFSNNKLKWDAHIWTGYAAVFCCAGGFFSGWLRHKEFYMKYILIVGHLACGYSAYGCALTSYATHKKVGKYSSMAAYGSFALSIIAMIIMSFHIFSTDRKMGMKPKRLQFPIIAIRFDDVFPLGHRFRIIFLCSYAVALFLVCGAMIFIE